MQMKIIQKLKSKIDLEIYLNTKYIRTKYQQKLEGGKCWDLSLNTALPLYMSSYNQFLDWDTKGKCYKDNEH